jgi:predicted transcriptional regulator
VDELLAGSQQDFPVVDGGQVLGILRRNDLVKALAEGRRDALVGGVMCRDCTGVNDTDLLTRTIEAMRQSECTTVPVLSQNQIVGLLTLENISEVIMVNAALAQGQGPPPLK